VAFLDDYLSLSLSPSFFLSRFDVKPRNEQNAMDVREILTQRAPRHIHAAGAACGATAESRDASSRARAKSALNLKAI